MKGEAPVINISPGIHWTLKFYFGPWGIEYQNIGASSNRIPFKEPRAQHCIRVHQGLCIWKGKLQLSIFLQESTGSWECYFRPWGIEYQNIGTIPNRILFKVPRVQHWIRVHQGPRIWKGKSQL
jgi:hypothetical protein